MRPRVFTRTSPRLSFATPIVAARPSFVVGGATELLALPQPATASATSGSAATLPRRVFDLFRIIWSLLFVCVESICRSCLPEQHDRRRVNRHRRARQNPHGGYRGSWIPACGDAPAAPTEGALWAPGVPLLCLRPAVDLAAPARIERIPVAVVQPKLVTVLQQLKGPLRRAGEVPRSLRVAAEPGWCHEVRDLHRLAGCRRSHVDKRRSLYGIRRLERVDAGARLRSDDRHPVEIRIDQHLPQLMAERDLPVVEHGDHGVGHAVVEIVVAGADPALRRIHHADLPGSGRSLAEEEL